MTRVDVADQIPGHLDCVGEGWHPLLLRLHQELLPLCPGYTVEQVKEKFGTLRVYLGEEVTEPTACALVDAAEAASERVCEFCGKPGVARGRGWVKTLCDGCAS